MLIHSCTFCGHQFEGEPTESEVTAHLEICPGPPDEDCTCAEARGLAKGLLCRSCVMKRAQRT